MTQEFNPLLSSDTTNYGSGKFERTQEELKPSLQGLFKYATKTEKLLCLVACIFGVFYTVFIIGGVVVYVQPINQLILYEGLTREALANSTADIDVEAIVQSQDQLRQWAHFTLPVCAVFTLCTFACSVANLCIFGYVSVHVTKRLRRKYLDKVLSMDMAWSQAMNSGQLIAMFDHHITKVSDALENNIPQSFSLLFLCAFTIVTTVLVDWDLSLVTMSMLIPAVFVFISGTKHYLKTIALEQSFLSKASKIASECFLCIKTVICFNGQKQTVEKYESHLNEAMERSKERSWWSSIADALKILLLDCVIVVGITYGSFTLGDKQPGNMIAIVLLFVVISNLIPTINMHVNSIFEAIASANEINKILLIKSEIEVPGGMSLTRIGPEIVFNNVSFAYASRPELAVIKDFSLRIWPGDKIAIVGESGSGKSTVAALLMRFYDPTNGTITLDDSPLRSLNVKWLRQQFGFVGQEPALFDMSIRDNLKCGSDYTDEEILQALRQANALDFVMQMPEGLDTRAGERGSQFSGGEKQRLAIARALLPNPKVLLFDEATSSLDSHSETLVQEAIDKVSKARTTITIAHRLSTILNADNVLVMDRGAVVESGEPQELIAMRRRFYHMLRQQDIAQHTGRMSSLSEASDSESDLTPKTVRRACKRSISKTLSIILSTSIDYSIDRSDSVYHSNILEEDDLLKNAARTTDKKLAVKKIAQLHPPSRLLAFLMIASSVCRAFRQIVVSILIAIQVDSLSYPTRQMVTRLLYSALGFVAIAILGFFAELGMYIPICLYSDQLSTKIRLSMLKHYLCQNLAYFDQNGHDSGTLSATLSTHPANVRDTLSSKAPELITNVIAILSATVVALCIEPRLALIAVCMHIFSLSMQAVQISALMKAEHKLQPLRCRAVALVSEAFTNLKTVKAFSLEKYFCERYAVAEGVIDKTRVRRIVTNAILIATVSSIWMLNSAILVTCASFFMLASPAVTVFRFQAVLRLIENPFGRLLAVLSQGLSIARSLSSCVTLSETFDEPRVSEFLSNAGCKPDLKGKIQFKQVSFNYPTRPDVQVYKELDFTIRSGRTVAIVGPSGSGKSTILELILRLYDPTSGEVTIENTNVSVINQTHLHKMVVPVAQEPVLFDGTVWENICYGLESYGITPNMVYRAAKSANIDDFIRSLPEQYSTQVGQLGAELSGGQRQRLAIARALIREPAVLLLDECTAALDSASEAMVQETIEKVRRKCTCIMVAHRLSTVQNADKIIVLNEGKIVEEGNHDQLMLKKGFYFEMCMQQKALL